MTSAGLRAGFARADITPVLGTPLMGYRVGVERNAMAVRDGLAASVLALKHDDADTVLVGLDLCVIDAGLDGRVRRAVAERVGVEAGRVTVACSHTHSAPWTGLGTGLDAVDEAYVDGTLIPGIERAAEAAAAALAPALIGVGTACCDAGINRRPINERHEAELGQCVWEPYDPTLSVLRFATLAGEPIVNLVHYTAHPTVLGPGSTVISRDWPGVMLDRLEQRSGAPGMFVNGALGDVAPRTNSGRATGDGEAALHEAGGLAATSALAAWGKAGELREMPMSMREVPIELPYEPLPERALVEAKLRETEATQDQPGIPRLEHRHWRAVLAALEDPPITGLPYSAVAIAIGPIVLLPMPGEPFVRIGLRLRELSPFPYTLTLGVCGGYVGYLCDRESVCRGGYERWAMRFKDAYRFVEGVDDLLVEQYAQAVHTLWPSVHAKDGGEARGLR